MAISLFYGHCKLAADENAVVLERKYFCLFPVFLKEKQSVVGRTIMETNKKSKMTERDDNQFFVSKCNCGEDGYSATKFIKISTQ